MTRTVALIHAALTILAAALAGWFVHAHGGNPWPLAALVVALSYAGLLRDLTRRSEAGSGRRHDPDYDPTYLAAGIPTTRRRDRGESRPE